MNLPHIKPRALALALLAVALPLLFAWLLVRITVMQEKRMSSPEGLENNEDI